MLEWIVSGSFLILVVLVLRAALGQKISARFRYALWALVLLRLLAPVQLFPSPVAGITVQVSEQVRERMAEKSIYAIPIDRIPVEDAEGYVIGEDGQVGGVTSFGYAKLENNGEIIVRYADKLSPLQILQIIWSFGGAVFLFTILINNLRFMARLRRVRKPLETAACRIPVYVADGLPSPCLFGVLHPAVYLTAKAAENPDILRHVLVHELTHYQHLDHIWSILRGVALAVHWWNPLVWLAVVYSRRDGELACDEGALKGVGQTERTAYGETLLALVTAKPSPRDLFRCATTMSGEKRSLRERIHRISCEPKQLVSAFTAAIILISVTTVCAFGRAEELETPDAYTFRSLSHQPDLNRDGIPETVQVIEKKGGGTPEWRLELNQGDTDIWSVTLDETHGNCGTYFLYRKGEDYLLEYTPKMRQGYSAYAYRLFHIEDGKEVTDQKNEIEFDINFSSPDHNFDPYAVASFMNEVNALIRNSELLVNTNHYALHLEEDSAGRLYDNILAGLPRIQETEYSPETLFGVLQEFDSYAEDRPDDTNSPLGSLLAEIEPADFQTLDRDAADKLAGLLRKADRVSRFYDYSDTAYAGDESWAWSRAGWNIPLADGGILHLEASARDAGVYIFWEAADSTTAACYSSKELNELIYNTGNHYPREILSSDLDLDHNGKPETMWLATCEDGSTFALNCIGGDGDGEWSWFQTAYRPHVGWNALFLCRVNGEDYLLQYNPYMGGGVCQYSYKLFYLQDGREVVVQESEVDFDIIFNPDYEEQHIFEPKAIAAFMDEINALLADSVQLLNTDENLLGTFEREGRLYDSLWWLDDDREKDLSLLENLEAYQDNAEKGESK